MASAKNASLPAIYSGQGDANPSYSPEFEVPCTASYEFITPAIAKDMLAAGNRRNRELSIPAVTRFGGILDRYEWFYDSTDAIGLAADDAVVNGQHRLTVIAKGDKGVWCLVVRGVRPEVIQVIDQGTARSLSQTLALDGSYSEPSTTAGAVEWLYRMVYGLEKTMPTSQKPSVPQELQLLAKHPHIVDSIGAAANVSSSLRLPLTKGVLTAYHYAFASADPDLADDFFEKLASGAAIGDGEAVHMLREKFIADMAKPRDNRMARFEAAHYLVTAWEAARAAKPLAKNALKFIRAGSHATVVASVTGVDWLSDDQPAEEAA